jgi:hypothetical protein
VTVEPSRTTFQALTLVEVVVERAGCADRQRVAAVAALWTFQADLSVVVEVAHQRSASLGFRAEGPEVKLTAAFALALAIAS